MTPSAPVNRLQNSAPKIGIRPTIDGRYGGVRESLEAPTMAMARAAEKFLTQNVRHASGLSVECVIADSCIGGIAEAAQCAEKFRREGVGVSLTVSPCWCYGAETIDMDPLIPKAIWGFNGSNRPGAVYLAAALAAHAQKGLPAFGIYGRDVQDIVDIEKIPSDVGIKLLQFARAGLAVAAMRGTSYLAMGGVSMGIAGSIVNHDFFQDYLGMRTETVDMTEFSRRIERQIYDVKEYRVALSWVRKNCPEGKDWNPPERQRSRRQKDQDWETSVKMALIARDLMVGNPRLAELGFPEEARGHDALAGGFQGQRQWTDHYPNGDFMEAILNTSFDWNGIRQPYMVATENDALNGASMLFGHLLTGTAQLFADVRTFWSPAAIKRVTGYTLPDVAALGILHLINSGPAALDWTGEQTGIDENGALKPVVKPHWEVSPKEAAKCLNATQWCASDLGYFPGGGWSTDLLTRGGMKATMFRLNLVKGLGPTLQIVEGETIDLPFEVHQKLDERTNPTWPTTWFAPSLANSNGDDAYFAMNNWGANHAAVCSGHIAETLITLASMLRIPVDMHGVRGDNGIRPAVWSRFGTTDPESADFRACATYGPLYA